MFPLIAVYCQDPHVRDRRALGRSRSTRSPVPHPGSGYLIGEAKLKRLFSTVIATVLFTGMVAAPADAYRRKGHSARDYARSQVSARQFACLNKLWNRESGWNHRAMNPSSGAYGIPQALPGWKMRSAGADWRTNPRTQVRWGLHLYIKPRYGTPCAAWAHSQRYGWY